MFATIRRKKNILILFLSLSAANITAFQGTPWLFPQIILFLFFIWFFLVLACFLIVRQERLSDIFLSFTLKSWHIFPFLIFSGLSIFWSVAWQVSLFKWLTLLSTLIVGVYLGHRYSLTDFFRLVSLFIAGLFLFNVFYVVFLPNFGIMSYYSIQGAWKGIFWHKNHLGFIVAFSSLFFLINTILVYVQKQKTVLIFFGAYLLSLFVLYKTDSVGALLTMIMVHGCIFVGWAYIRFGHRLNRVYYGLFIGLSGIIILLFFLNIETVFSVFNRNTTMTGRIPMWSYVFETYLSQKPLLGYGFNAFWHVTDYRADIGLAAGYPDPIVIADSGFLDILFGTGYIGLILFLFFYGDAIWQSFLFALHGETILDIFPLTLLIFITVANISWTILLENESFFFLILVTTLFSTKFHSTSFNQNFS